MVFKVNQEIASCGGKLLKLSHDAVSTHTKMDVNVYLPKQFYGEPSTQLIPTIYYLSGLTCTPQNASEKAFWQFQADRFGFVMVFPDTSPRGDDVPSDPQGSWDFGQGAGFYINATKKPYNTHYNMYEYIHNELPLSLDKYFNNLQSSTTNKIDFINNVSITGHSMGGFGSIVGFLTNLKRYKSCSAFAPILNPKVVPWGQKAFNGYLQNENEWDQYDPITLLKNIPYQEDKKILIHIGTNDPFLKDQLKPEIFIDSLKDEKWRKNIDINMVEGFDHSYYFISTFVPKHAEFHAKHLGLI